MVSEEENQFFDEDHENEIKDRLVPMINGTVPIDYIDLTRFDNDNPKITKDELINAIKKQNREFQD